MKKLCLILAALVLLTLLPGLAAYAADGDGEESSSLDLVTDVADVLSYQEWDDLTLRCEQMTADYGCQVLIVTWDDLEGDFTDSEFCEALFDWYDVGVGADRSCVMLMVSMKEDYCYVFTHGTGSTAVGDSEKAALIGIVRDEMNWADAFNAYLDRCGQYLSGEREASRDTAPAAAETTAAETTASSGALDPVTDAAGLLTEEQRKTLNDRAQALTEKYGIAVRIITVDSIGSYNIEDFAEAVFDEYHLGYGPQNSCIMLLMSMEYRDYDIFAHGYGNEAFTDYGKEKLDGYFLPKFKNNDWYGGFTGFLDGCDEYLRLAAAGTPVDRGSMSRGAKTVIHLVIAFIPALIVALILKGKMKTVAKQRSAAAYTGLDQLDLRFKEDRFLHRSQTRTRIETNSGSRSGGGTSVNSHGSSHHSGKF